MVYRLFSLVFIAVMGSVEVPCQASFEQKFGYLFIDVVVVDLHEVSVVSAHVGDCDRVVRRCVYWLPVVS